MRYLLLIHAAEDVGPRPGTPEFDTLLGQYGQVTQVMQEAGVLVSGEALQPTSTATSVRVRNGRRETMDGRPPRGHRGGPGRVLSPRVPRPRCGAGLGVPSARRPVGHGGGPPRDGDGVTMTSAPDLPGHLAAMVRRDWGRLLSALIAELRDWDLAEDALAEAVEAALRHWGRAGRPERPEAWLLRVVRRKAIDRIRRDTRWRDRTADLARLVQTDQDAAQEPAPPIPDERLQLILTCCHQALDPKSRVALTLRTLGGLSTAEIARAFLDTEPTMAQRLARAKAKIRDAGIRFALPEPADWEPRSASVSTSST